MLRSITWGLYLEALLILIPVYYLIILALYYRQDIILWVYQRRRQRGRQRGRQSRQSGYGNTYTGSGSINGSMSEDAGNINADSLEQGKGVTRSNDPVSVK